jgi:hypothetical protein
MVSSVLDVISPFDRRCHGRLHMRACGFAPVYNMPVCSASPPCSTLSHKYAGVLPFISCGRGVCERYI